MTPCAIIAGAAARLNASYLMAKEGERKLSLGCSVGRGGGEQRCATMWQNFLLCLRGGNWDTKPAGRSHPSFPFSLSVILSERLWQLWHVMAAAASHPRGFLSLFMISCFLCGSLPRPPTGARGLAASEAWPPEGRRLKRAGRR